MREYSNRRRSHIHFIKQFYSANGEYTGTRIVIFTDDKKKYIYDIDDFKIHRYKNPKSKNNGKSLWNIVPSNLEGVIKKEMINFSEDKKLKMYHTIYESIELDIKEYYLMVFEKENVPIFKIHID
ncbi:hypothetical protein [Clostridium lundense]|uniref:hypothetical protein n=1 Tax=Clostridium lundense TaxID=319475 RepID=UPI00048441EF|nr:hypothetical protein [Clostridium lundense]